MDRRYGAAREAELESAVTRGAPRRSLGTAADADAIQLGEVMAAAARQRPIAVQHDEEIRPGGHLGAAIVRVGIFGARGRAGHAAPIVTATATAWAGGGQWLEGFGCGSWRVWSCPGPGASVFSANEFTLG